jgi:HTH-type transcriptional regulator / antitoxin HipB
MRVTEAEDAKKVGNMVRFHCKMTGLSQIELAAFAGLGKTVIFDIEKGKLSP